MDDDRRSRRRAFSYKVVGYINNRNLVERVQTWLENPIFGDMLVEAIYTEYRDANGVKYPSTIVQKRGGQPVFEAQILRHPREPLQYRGARHAPGGRRARRPRRRGSAAGCRGTDVGEAR